MTSSGTIVGITGGIACGKSQVSKMLEEFGAIPINVDAIGHKLIKKGNPEYDRIVELFGEGILDKSGEISRTKLGKLVFSCELKRRRLNAIMHPPMIEGALEIGYNLIKSNPQAIVLLDSPLLIEVNLHKVVDLTVVVICAESIQIKRIIDRSIKNGKRLSIEEARARIKSQMPVEGKMKYANFVIENNGSLDELREKVEKLWAQIQKRKTFSHKINAGLCFNEKEKSVTQ